MLDGPSYLMRHSRSENWQKKEPKCKKWENGRKATAGCTSSYGKRNVKEPKCKKWEGTDGKGLKCKKWEGAAMLKMGKRTERDRNVKNGKADGKLNMAPASGRGAPERQKRLAAPGPDPRFPAGQPFCHR